MSDLPRMSPDELMQKIDYSVFMGRIKQSDIEAGHDAYINNDIDITNSVYMFEVTDSLDQAFRVGRIVLNDLEGVRKLWPLTGNEVFTIRYKNLISPNNSPEKQVRFRVFNIQEVPLSDSASRSKQIMLTLVEFPIYDMLTANQIYKTYPITDKNNANTKVSDIVRDIIKLVPNLSKWTQLDIQETAPNAVSLFIPNWTPIKAINFLKSFAISDKDSMPFYSFRARNAFGESLSLDKPVLTFRSVYSMMKDVKSSRKYGSSNEHVSRTINTVEDGRESNNTNTTNPAYNPLDILSNPVFKYFDGSLISSGGLSGDTNFTFDFLNDNTYFATDYSTYIDHIYKSIDPVGMHGIRYGNAWSNFTPSGWNYETAKTICTREDYVRMSKNTLMGGIWCTADSRVYEARNPGERAELLFSNFRADGTDNIDLMFSGAWLTWSVTDRVIQGNGGSTVKFVKDSYLSDNTNGYLKKNSTIATTDTQSLIKG